jgi:hypothetical protein
MPKASKASAKCELSKQARANPASLVSLNIADKINAKSRGCMSKKKLYTLFDCQNSGS